MTLATNESEAFIQHAGYMMSSNMYGLLHEAFSRMAKRMDDDCVAFAFLFSKVSGG